MSDPAPRSFDQAFKRKVVERIHAGEPISALSAELGIKRQILYRWRDAFAAGGSPRPRGRPPKAEALARQADTAGLSDLQIAQRRVAELERKVGQQQLELDFFQQTLRRLEEMRRLEAERGATSSSRRSKR
jgi:transposase